MIDADPQRIAQVLANLVTNALRYTPHGGAITLCASTAEQQISSTVVGRRSSVVIQVSDTGAGIAAENLPHIFDRFYRADRSRARGSGGAGLGLAIAKQIVTAHGGSIWATSVEGQGTTIHVALPVENTED